MTSGSRKHRRGPWSSTEDQYLVSLVNHHGAHNWVRISEIMQDRSPKQCRERYHQNLKPSLNLSPITPEEGVAIERMVAEMGKRWAEIARRLHNRSDNAVKNWWNGGVNRRKRLEGRKMEAARRGPFQRGMMEQPQSQPNLALNPQFAEYAQRPAYPIDQYSQMSRMVPPPHPVFTGHAQVPSQRHLMDPQLPSPSAVSHQSHAESDEGAPPSLISDSSRNYSTNHSPSAPHPNVELPPLAVVPQDKMAYIPPAQEYAYQHNAAQQGWPTAPQDMYQSRDFSQQPTSFYQYNGYNPQMQAFPTQHAAYQPLPTQLPLPPFHTVSAPHLRQPNESQQLKDNRMSLSTLTN